MELPTVYYPSKKEEWGPSFWNFYHNFATKYPEKPTRHDKLAASDTIRRFIDAIPCNNCETDFKQWVKDNPPNLNSKQELFDWTVRGHNHVNKKTGKPEFKAVLGKQPETLIVKEPVRTISNDKMTITNKFANFSFDNFDKQFPMYKSLDDALGYPSPAPVPTPTDPISQTPSTEIVSQAPMDQKPVDDWDHAFSQFNSVYQFPAETVGLKPVETNLIYTPQILSAISQLVVETNMTELGAMGVSLLATIGLLTSSVLMRPQLSHGDKILLQQISANYLTNTLKYTNPKSLHNILQDGSKLVELIFNWGKSDEPMKELFQTLILTPNMLREQEKQKAEEEAARGLMRIANKALQTDEFGNIIENDFDIDPYSYATISDIRGKQLASGRLADSKFPTSSIVPGNRSVNMFGSPRPTQRILNTVPSPLSYEQDFGYESNLSDYPIL